MSDNGTAVVRPGDVVVKARNGRFRAATPGDMSERRNFFRMVDAGFGEFPVLVSSRNREKERLFVGDGNGGCKPATIGDVKEGRAFRFVHDPMSVQSRAPVSAEQVNGNRFMYRVKPGKSQPENQTVPETSGARVTAHVGNDVVTPRAGVDRPVEAVPGENTGNFLFSSGGPSFDPLAFGV